LRRHGSSAKRSRFERSPPAPRKWDLNLSPADNAGKLMPEKASGWQHGPQRPRGTAGQFGAQDVAGGPVMGEHRARRISWGGESGEWQERDISSRGGAVSAATWIGGLLGPPRRQDLFAGASFNGRAEICKGWPDPIERRGAVFRRRGVVPSRTRGSCHNGTLARGLLGEWLLLACSPSVSSEGIRARGPPSTAKGGLLRVPHERLFLL
jgi:hypothetical protein